MPPTQDRAINYSFNAFFTALTQNPQCWIPKSGTNHKVLVQNRGRLTHD